MADEVKVILDLSDEVQSLLARQRVNLYREIQKELPDIKLEVQSDPNAPAGSRDFTTVILAAASLMTALTPIILRILNQITPPNRFQTYTVEETETRDPDGRVIITRKRITALNEQRPQEQQVDQSRQAKLPTLKETKETRE
jgi:hypothetical protein